MKKLSIIVADDHAVVRGGIQHIISSHFESAVFFVCEDGEQVLQRAAEVACDLVVMDISMPGKGGLETLRVLKERFPGLPVIILTVYKEEQYATRAFQLGASAYLKKGAADEELVKAVATVLEGGKYFTPGAATHLLASLEGKSDQNRLGHLSEREHSILLLIVEGQSLKEIAYQLDLSPKTVSTYRARILEKLGLDSNAALVQFALKNGLID